MSTTASSVTESPYPMISVDEAVKIVLENTRVLGPQSVALSDAVGRYAYEDVRATRPLPAMRTSVMDGYAVITGGGPGEYKIVDRILAGHRAQVTLSPSSAAYITTGAPLPENAEAIVKIEDTKMSEKEGHVTVLNNPSKGEYVRPVGSDIKMGALLISKGDLITPQSIGLAASIGLKSLTVHRKPRVAILSTGDELMTQNSTEKKEEKDDKVALNSSASPIPQPEKLFDSNGPMLHALVQSIGAIPIPLGIVKDTEAGKISKIISGDLLQSVQPVDVLVTSGGVSMGDADIVKKALEGGRGVVHFGRMRMKPGKPTTFATLSIQENSQSEIKRNRLIFSLPGNPVSCAVTFELLVATCLRKLSGSLQAPREPTFLSKLTTPIKMDPFRPEYHRVRVEWDASQQALTATSTGRQASSCLLSFRNANALLLVPKGEGVVKAGMSLPTLPLSNPYESKTSALLSPSSGPLVGSHRKHNTKHSTSLKPELIESEIGLGILDVTNDGFLSGDLRDMMGRIQGVNLRANISIGPKPTHKLTKSYLNLLSKTPGVDMIVVFGGNGFGESDRSPEAVKEIITKDAPALSIAVGEAAKSAMPNNSPPFRTVTGSDGCTLIMTLPGNLAAVGHVFDRALVIFAHACKEISKQLSL